MSRIQLITIVISVSFLGLVSRLIVKGRLREEYSIVWFLFTSILVIFSFWERGLNVLSQAFGVFIPANLVFTVSIFIALVYLLHLSVVSSKLQKQNKQMAQEIALLKNELLDIKKESTSEKKETL